MKTQYRDLTVVPLNADEDLVIACDSSAGIGAKSADAVSVAPEIMAAYAVRVPLLELLCVGVNLLAAVDTIGNEMEPTGRQLIWGVRQELAQAGYPDLPLNGSTEDNMPTTTTSLGITLIGRLAKTAWRPQTAEPLQVYQLGDPYVGDDVVAHLADIFSYDVIKKLRRFKGVQDLLPVGSKGMRYELGQMAQTQAHPTIHWQVPEDAVQLDQSAGPATVALVGVKRSRAAAIEAAFPELKRLAELEVADV
ncbi:hypothetical protein [Levilactobacillus cerevisiae]|uniref:hypothetical protein n=1 Tax=Levilactobacillus cerevisiae TaxID=1704076 RepID=UPI000F797276|nr:hypothetical protein [Levilactobacillus cerevisiae]